MNSNLLDFKDINFQNHHICSCSLDLVRNSTCGPKKQNFVLNRYETLISAPHSPYLNNSLLLLFCETEQNK